MKDKLADASCMLLTDVALALAMMVLGFGPTNQWGMRVLGAILALKGMVLLALHYQKRRPNRRFLFSGSVWFVASIATTNALLFLAAGLAFVGGITDVLALESEAEGADDPN